jgi:hypothetical protein
VADVGGQRVDPVGVGAGQGQGVVAAVLEPEVVVEPALEVGGLAFELGGVVGVVPEL